MTVAINLVPFRLASPQDAKMQRTVPSFGFVGGEIVEYTKLIAEAREQAIDRMISEAEKLNADAVVNVRFTTSVLMGGAAELLAYGTAVKLG